MPIIPCRDCPDIAAIDLLVGNQNDLVGFGMQVILGEMNFDLAVMFTEFYLLLRCQILITKHQNKMFEKRLMDRIIGRRINVTDINAGHFRAKRV